MKIRRFAPMFFAAVLMTAMLAACGSPAPETPPPFDFEDPTAQTAPEGDPDVPPEERQVIATVNGEPIYLDEYQRELARYEAGQATLGINPENQPGYRQQVLDVLVEQELIAQEAAEQGITVSDEAVQTEIEQLVAENGQEYFNNWLQTSLYTIDEFREVIRLELLRQQLLAPVLEQVPTEVRHARARHILVNSEEQAQTVLTRLEGGEEFAALAEEFSVDVTSRDNGGDLGWFPRGLLLVPEVEEVVFSMEPGQRSGVVASDWGYHVIETLEFDDSRAVDPETYQRLRNRAAEEWLRGLRNAATIEQLVEL